MERIQTALAKKSLGCALSDAISDLDETDPAGIVTRAEDAARRNLGVMGKALRDGEIGF